MYHFIRRFFLFVLVFACCFSFTRSGHTQYPGGDYGFDWSATYGMVYGVSGLISTYGMGDNGWDFPSSIGMGYVDSGLPSSNGIVQQSYASAQFQHGGGVPSSVLMYSQPIGQSLFSGSPASLIDRSGLALTTSNQQHIAYTVYLNYGPVVGTPPSALPTSLTRYYSPYTLGSLQPGVSLEGIPLALSYLMMPHPHYDMSDYPSIGYGSLFGMHNFTGPSPFDYY